MRFVVILYGFRGYFKQKKTPNQQQKSFYEIENVTTFHKNLKPFPLWIE